MNIWRVPYPKFGDGPALDRVARLAERLGIDLQAFGSNAATVIGSNGKGSTAAMAAALIAEAHPNVGLFTSPHLLALNERFRIGPDDISDAELGHHWGRAEEAIAAAGLVHAVGGFEFLFLIAADWFRERGCTHTVWEAGLGGRLDPVRLIEAKRTALTALDLEHTVLLGDTLRDIAIEKIAAVKAGHALAVSEEIASNAEVFTEVEAWTRRARVQLEVVRALNDAPLIGIHQRANAGLALWLAAGGASLTDAQIQDGFAETRWPGRLDVLSNDPLQVIDVGHTPDGVTVALTAFKEMHGDKSSVLVCGVSDDKDASAIISRLAPSFTKVVCAASRHKGAPVAQIAFHAQEANPAAEIILSDSVEDARELALSRAGGGAIYVAGGLFLAAEYKAVHLGRDPASLVFF